MSGQKVGKNNGMQKTVFFFSPTPDDLPLRIITLLGDDRCLSSMLSNSKLKQPTEHEQKFQTRGGYYHGINCLVINWFQTVWNPTLPQNTSRQLDGMQISIWSSIHTIKSSSPLYKRVSVSSNLWYMVIEHPSGDKRYRKISNIRCTRSRT